MPTEGIKNVMKLVLRGAYTVQNEAPSESLSAATNDRDPGVP